MHNNSIYKPAKELIPGDKLRTAYGKYVNIIDVKVRKKTTLVQYNVDSNQPPVNKPFWYFTFPNDELCNVLS